MDRSIAHPSLQSDQQIENLFILFDSRIMRWVWIYLFLGVALLATLTLFFAAIVLQIHYLIATASGTLIIGLVLLFSSHTLCREGFYTLLEQTQAALKKILDEKEGDNRQAIAEEFLKNGSIIKKRWQKLIRNPPSIYRRIISFPKSYLVHELFWLPYFLLAEFFFHSAKSHYIELIRKSPKNLELHTCLANTYVTLATHMKEILTTKNRLLLRGKYLSNKFFSNIERKFDLSSLRAIQELSILRSFQPNELWVLDQLAISYRELEMVDEEIEIYNSILALYPDDTNALFRLGLLSFEKGENARGLEIYGELAYLHPVLAQEVIRSFGAYDESISARWPHLNT
ncbi:MAG: tetratricopeptide repeat protein [Chlamydia sp.]